MGSRDHYFQILVVNRQGYIDELKDIFAQHLDVHEIHPSDHTNYLHIALQNASQTTPPIETIQFYLDQGLDVNLQDHVGNTPLHYALMKGNLNAALLLLQHGANATVANLEQDTPLSLLTTINQPEQRVDLLKAMLQQQTLNQTHIPSKLIDLYNKKVQTDPAFDNMLDVLRTHLQQQPPVPAAPMTEKPAPIPNFIPVAIVPKETQAAKPAQEATPQPMVEALHHPSISREIHLLIHENILVSNEIVQHLMSTFAINEQHLSTVQTLVRHAKQAFIAEQKSWPGMTDCDKLLLAFYAAFKQDVIALPAAGLNAEQALSNVRTFQKQYQGQRNFQGYCFFTEQDIRHAIDHHELSVAFGHIDTRVNDIVGDRIGKIIFEKLNEQGLQATWNGHYNQAIVLRNFHWRNRTDFHLFKNKYLN